jgi:hypothetical protein
MATTAVVPQQQQGGVGTLYWQPAGWQQGSEQPGSRQVEAVHAGAPSMGVVG